MVQARAGTRDVYFRPYLSTFKLKSNCGDCTYLRHLATISVIWLLDSFLHWRRGWNVLNRICI